MNGAEDPEEDLLREVQGFVAVAQEVEREGVDHPLVSGDQLRAGALFSCGAPLNEGSLSRRDIRPPERASFFHEFLGDKSWTHD